MSAQPKTSHPDTEEVITDDALSGVVESGGFATSIEADRYQMEVYVTYQYDAFTLEETNRKVKTGLVKDISESMRKHGFLQSQAILVSKDLSVIDGQHRLKAAEMAGEPVWFVRTGKEYDSALVIDLNTTSSNWGLSDYSEHYISRGEDSYAMLKDFCEEYGLATTIGISCLTGGIADKDEFRAGGYTYPADDSAGRAVGYVLREMRGYLATALVHNTTHVRAVYKAITQHDLDPEELARKIEEYSQAAAYTRPALDGQIGWLRQIEDAWNRYRAGSHRIRIS